LILMSGRTVTPLVFAIGTMKYVRPLYLSFVSWRQSMIIQLAKCARLVHTLWPLMTQWSPCRTADDCAPARSLPAPGSENPWHQISSEERRGGRYRRFCSSLPCTRIV